MDDLVDRLRELEQNQAPDLWPDVRYRVAGAEPKVVRSPLRRRVLTGAIAAVIGVSAVALVVIAFRPSASPVLSPAPRDCPTRPLETPATGVAEFTGLIHGYLPTWLPEGFGLMKTYGSEAVRLGRNAYGVWSDGRCREVELSFGPNSSLVQSVFLPGHGPWTVSNLPGECGNKVLGRSTCLYYVAKTPNGTDILSLSMTGLDRADGDRIALSILPGHVECGMSCTPPSSTSGDPAVLQHESFPVDGDVFSVVAGDGWVWVASDDGGLNGASLERIDPRTRKVGLSIPLPSRADFLAAGEGKVWAVVHDPVARAPETLEIDAATGKIVDRLPGVYEPLVAAADGTVWAVRATAEGTNELVHLVSGSVISRVPVDASPFDMVEAAGSIWVLLAQHKPMLDPDLIRIDEGTGAESARIRVGLAGTWLAGNDQGVWLSSSLQATGGTSIFVSAFDDSVTPFGTISNFRPFAVADGRVWFIAGPHDGAVQGICGLNLQTQIPDACGDDGVGPDLEGARDPAAYEPTTNTFWSGQYLKAMVTRVEAP